MLCNDSMLPSNETCAKPMDSQDPIYYGSLKIYRQFFRVQNVGNKEAITFKLWAPLILCLICSINQVERLRYNRNGVGRNGQWLIRYEKTTTTHHTRISATASNKPGGNYHNDTRNRENPILKCAMRIYHKSTLPKRRHGDYRVPYMCPLEEEAS